MSVRFLVLLLACLQARTTSSVVPCNGTGAPCFIQLGGVYNKGCGDTRYIASSIAMVKIVNGLNNGKGFGVTAGGNENKHFFQFNFSFATYEKDEYDTVGAALAANLFPRLDFIVGQGAHCGAEDKNTLKMARIADNDHKLYLTQRGPSRFMTAEPQKSHMFSTHLNSDEYATPAIRRYALNGIKNAALVARKTENFFFSGVQLGIRQRLGEAKIDLPIDIELDDGNDDSWQDKINATMRLAVNMGIDVLFLTCTDAPMELAMQLVRQMQYEHSFKSIWMIGGVCKFGTDCGHILGGNQISPVETASFRDTLTGLTASEVISSPHWPADILPLDTPQMDNQADIFAAVSAVAQVIQTYWLFRPFDSTKFISDPNVYTELRKSMASGMTLGYSFRGPLTWSATGALNGRQPSAIQNDLSGNYKLIFSDIEEQSFVFPAPASLACPWQHFRNYSLASCQLCSHECKKCYDKTTWVQDEVCGCVEGAFSPAQQIGVACQECPAPGGVCKGNTHLPYPAGGYWGNSSDPIKFYECYNYKWCIGGVNFTCQDGYSYNMCQGTAPDYFSLGNAVRFKCPTTSSGKWLLALLIIFLVLLAFVVINNYLVANFDSMDIFLDSIQRLAIVSQFQLRWHDGFAWFFFIFDTVLLDADLCRPECLMRWSFNESFWLQFGVLFLFILQFWLPCLWKCVREKRKHQRAWSEIVMKENSTCADDVHKSIQRTIDILSMMYAGIAKNVFDVFNCREISGQRWLRTDPNFQCDSSQHTTLLVFSSLVLVFYIVGFPVAMGVVLWKKQKNSEIHGKRLLATLGTLYDRYEPPYMWWESWRTTQMGMLVAIGALVQDPRMQANLALLLFGMSFATHIVTKPYASEELDKLDTLSYAFNCWWVLLGINFYMPSGGGGFYGGKDDDSKAITLFKDTLFSVSIISLGIYFLAACIITQIDVKERVNSQKAAKKLAFLAKSGALAREGGGEDEREEGEEGARGEEQLSEIQQTLDGTLLLKWVESGDVSELAKSYEALKQMDKQIAHIVSDDSKTSHFSMLPEAHFYRELDKAFPQMLQWIASNDGQVSGLGSALHSLMEEGNQQKKAYNNLVLVRDRSSVIYWLVQEATEIQRQEFFSVLDTILLSNPDVNASLPQRAMSSMSLGLQRTISNNEQNSSKVMPYSES